MKVKADKAIRAALATFVAGAAVLLAGCEREPKPHAMAAKAVRAAAAGRKGVHVPTGRVAAAKHAVRATSPKAPRKMLPDALMRLLVDEAVDANDYARLSALLGKCDRIADPEIRMRLLEGLSWFDETAVEDALSFLLDPDEKVAAAAAALVTSRISTVGRQQQREKLYVAALKIMPDSPDRDILIAQLEGDRKSVCMHVLRDLEGVRASRPDLWRKVTDVYLAVFGRPYIDAVDAIMHYNPRED